MAGPTTEVLNEDLKEVKADLRDMRSSLEELKNVGHGTAISLAEMRGEFRFAKWFIGLTLGVTIGSIGTGIWWAATVTADLHNLEKGAAEKYQSIEKSSADRYHAIETRMDRLEASIAKLIEQTRPKP